MSYIRNMPFGYPDTFEVASPKPLDNKPSPWLNAPVLFEADSISPVADIHKKAFAIEWARLPGDPFKAATIVFAEDTTSALWASRNWILDPDVNAIKDQYSKSLEDNEKLLDRDETARKFLAFFNETSTSGRPAYDGKDRLTALLNYSKMMGYLDDSVIKQTINNNNNVNNNKMEVIFVDPDPAMIEKIAAIESKTANESKILEDEDLESSFGIKLVG